MVGLLAAALCAQVVVSFEVDGEGPVRFGFPVPVEAVERGLRLDGSPDARMQWSLLQPAPGRDGGRVWVETALVGQRGRGRLRIGGDGPVPRGGGDVVTVERSVDRTDAREERSVVWRWTDGTVDRMSRSILLEDEGDREAGEAITVLGDELLARRTRVRIAASSWRTAGVLPRADGSGTAWRRALRDALPHLPPAPGTRGRGDYVRGEDGEVVTNLEFDTTLGLARLALCEGDVGLLETAWRSCRHLLDVDLDRRSGLPFRHAGDHRRAPPETGHVWTSGCLLVACTFADRDAILEVLTIGRSLAASVRARTPPRGAADRMRDEAWPLFELEQLLRFADLPPLRAGADAAARAMLKRWDPALGCLRYGEGETRSAEVYRDRIWLTAGIALPALRLHQERTGNRHVAEVVDAVDRRVAAVLLDGGRGVPVQVAVGAHGPFDAVRAFGAAEGYLLLDGLGAGLRARALRRSGVRAGLEGALDREHDDLATRFSIVARCAWIYR